MRRTVAVLAILTLLGLGSSVASAATTRQAIALRAVIAQADWESIDEDTGAGEFGVVQFATEKTGTTVVVSISRGELVLCAGGDTPVDPTDDFYGFLGTSILGEGKAKLTVGRGFSSAAGSATVRASIATLDECSGDTEVVSARNISVTLDMTSIGPLLTQKSRTTASIPKQLRTKTFVQSRTREAAGTVVVDDRTLDVGGVVGELSLRAMATQR